MARQIENKVRKYVQQHNLIENKDQLIVGVSGGADSMMLLHFLYQHKAYYNLQIKVAHVHHGVRREAEDDALLVEKICEKWELPFYRHNCDIKKISAEKGISEEEAGRIERYNFFISLSNPHSKIVTAHNMNDQAETLIMRFLRGTDVNGLGGIAPKRDRIIRPLLCLKRNEIEEYCHIHEIVYQDDHTNFMTVYARNKIRLECIPYIEQNINPNIIQMLGEHSQLYRQEEDFLKAYTEEMFERCAKKQQGRISIDINSFESCYPYIQSRIILLSLHKLISTMKDITLKHIESVMGLVKMQSGKKISLPYHVTAYKEYDQLILCSSEPKHCSYAYSINLGEWEIPEAELIVTLRRVSKETIEQKSEKMYTKYIDYDKIKGRLQIRTRLPHDYIVTKEGTKKLKKVYTDDKLPKGQRDKTPLIADGSEIIWIVGGRLNYEYYITDETSKVLEIQISF